MKKLGKESVAHGITILMASLRQLKGDRKDFMEAMLPQRVEGNSLINFKGNAIRHWEAPDQEIVPMELVSEQKVVTDAFLTKVFKYTNDFFFSVEEESSEEPEEVEEPVESDAIGRDPDEEPEVEGHDEQLDTSALDKAIKKGKGKKASKLLAEIEGGMSKDQRKAYKKQIKEL